MIASLTCRQRLSVNVVVISSILTVALTYISMHFTVASLNFLSCLIEFSEFLSFLKLRMDKPEISRPFKVPLGTYGSFIVLFPSIFFILAMLLLATSQIWLISAIIVLVGLFIPSLMTFLRRKNICAFVNRYDEEDEGLSCENILTCQWMERRWTFNKQESVELSEQRSMTLAQEIMY